MAQMPQIAQNSLVFLCVLPAIPLYGTGSADRPFLPMFAPVQLENYIASQWVVGSGEQAELVNASTGDLIATTSSGGPACQQAGSTSSPCSTTPRTEGGPKSGC